VGDRLFSVSSAVGELLVLAVVYFAKRLAALLENGVGVRNNAVDPGAADRRAAATILAADGRRANILLFIVFYCVVHCHNWKCWPSNFGSSARLDCCGFFLLAALHRRHREEWGRGGAKRAM